MADRSETLQVTGIHCMNCIQAIGAALGGIEGLTGASATLTGAVSIRYDDADPRCGNASSRRWPAPGFPSPSD